MKYLYIIFFTIFFSAVQSQVSYTSGNYATGNYDIPMTTVISGIIPFNFDTTGANILWDYSGLGMDVSGKKYTVTASGSGYQAPYITQCILNGGGFACLTKWNGLTNIGVVDLDTLDAIVFTLFDVMTMARKNTGTLVGNVKGLKIKDTTGLTVPIVAEYSESDTILTFPFTFQDSGKSSGQWGLDLNSIGQNIQYKVSYVRNWEVDGWGQLITPFQTHNNVLKIKTTLDQVDSVVFLTTPLGLPRKIVEYTWYDPAFGLPVMRADGIETAGFVLITSVQYYDTRVLSINENAKETSINIFPNPASDVLNIESKDITIITYKIIDVNGKTIQTNKANKSIEIDNLPAGIYILQLFDSSNSLVFSQKFIKNLF